MIESGQASALAALFGAGLASGALNTVAGGGSFITLPLLLLIGLPAAEANGTNRVGVLTQNVAGVWGFHRHRVLDWRWAGAVSVPALAGAALGAWLAIVIPNFAFRRLLSVVMLGVVLGTLLRRARNRPTTEAPTAARSPWAPSIVFGFFLAGVYGGFLQAGVGFLLLSLTTSAGLDLMRGNAVKVLCVLLVTCLSLLIFIGNGRIVWPLGLALGAGNLVGGLLGVRLAVSVGQVWLERIVTITIVIFAVLLWM